MRIPKELIKKVLDPKLNKKQLKRVLAVIDNYGEHLEVGVLNVVHFGIALGKVEKVLVILEKYFKTNLEKIDLNRRGRTVDFDGLETDKVFAQIYKELLG